MYFCCKIEHFNFKIHGHCFFEAASSGHSRNCTDIPTYWLNELIKILSMDGGLGLYWNMWQWALPSQQACTVRWCLVHSRQPSLRISQYPMSAVGLSTSWLYLCYTLWSGPVILYLCNSSVLTCPILWSEALPRTDDLFGSYSFPRDSPVLFILILRFNGVDPALWRNIHFNLEKTETCCRKHEVRHSLGANLTWLVIYPLHTLDI